MKRYLRIIAVMLLAAMVLPMPAAAADLGPYEAAQRLADAKLFDGEAAYFRAADKLTLAEAAVILGRIVKYENKLENRFTDIDPNSEAGDSILRLAAAGVVYVPAAGDACSPNGYVSRQEAVNMLYKLFKMQPQGSAPGWQDYSAVTNTEAVNTFYALGYIPSHMLTGNCFAPNMAITRGQFAQLLCNVVACFADYEAVPSVIYGNVVMKKADKALNIQSGILYLTQELGQYGEAANVVFLGDSWGGSDAEFTQNIGSCTTNFPAGESGRNTNIAQASAYMSGTVVLPGQSFSFNQVVGIRTYARGFKDATVFVGSGTAQGVGGGICQVSSTLMVAALNAGMTITERHQHSMSVSYIDKGLDATVSYGELDFCFRNDLSVPVKVTAAADKASGTVRIDIWTLSSYNKPSTYVGSSYKNGKYYGYRYINGKLDWYTTSRY